MKKQILTMSFLCLVFVIFVFFFQKRTSLESFVVLGVVDASTFNIDINKNNKIDDNETFKLKNIVAFSSLKNQKTKKYAQKLNISEEEYVKVGYLAEMFAKDELNNKQIKMAMPKTGEKYVDIIYNNKNLAEFYLKNGLAFVYEKSDNPTYFQLQNIKQIKANAKEISKLDFVLVNLKTKIAHSLNSEHFSQINNGKLYLKKEIAKFNFKLCGFCFENIDKKSIQETIFKTSKNIYQKSINKKFDEVELFLINPIEFNRPSSSCNTKICQKIVEEINSATDSIDVALYGINEQMTIVNALKSAKKRGVKVRVVADYSDNTEKIYPYSKIFIDDFNAKTDSNKTLMHNKFIIFDNKKVLTGSMNFSSSGSGGYNSNIAAIINSAKVARFYKDEFNQMFDGKFSAKKEEIKKSKVKFDKTEILVYFSPKDNVFENGILPLIQNAKKKIYVSAFYLTDKKLINELINAKKRNVEIFVLMDSLGAMNFKDRINILKEAKIPVKAENWGGKNHEKTIMIDDEYLIFGSCNFTKSGFYKNDENVLIIKNPDIASFYGDYFLYLFNSIDNKYLKFIPRAESFESKNSCNDGIDNNFDGKVDSEDAGCRVK